MLFVTSSFIMGYYNIHVIITKFVVSVQTSSLTPAPYIYFSYISTSVSNRHLKLTMHKLKFRSSFPQNLVHFVPFKSVLSKQYKVMGDIVEGDVDIFV